MNIAEIRQKYPQYNDLNDSQLAGKLHAKYYSDMPINEFSQKIGITQPPTTMQKAVTSAPVNALAGAINSGVEGVKHALQTHYQPAAIPNQPQGNPLTGKPLASTDTRGGFQPPNHNIQSAFPLPGPNGGMETNNPFQRKKPLPPKEPRWLKDIKRGAKMLYSGYMSSGSETALDAANAADILNKTAGFISSKTGMSKPDSFAAAQHFFQRGAQSMTTDKPVTLADTINYSVGSLPGYIARLIALGAPKLGFTAAMGLEGALANEDKGPQAAVLGGVKGALLGKGLEAANMLSPVGRTAANAAVGAAASPENPVQGAIVQGGLGVVGGGGGKTLREAGSDLRKSFKKRDQRTTKPVAESQAPQGDTGVAPGRAGGVPELPTIDDVGSGPTDQGGGGGLPRRPLRNISSDILDEYVLKGNEAAIRERILRNKEAEGRTKRARGVQGRATKATLPPKPAPEPVKAAPKPTGKATAHGLTRSASSDNFIQRIKELGGITTREMPDITGERKATNTGTVGLFRKKGKGIDSLIEGLGSDFGIDTSSADGGVQQFRDMVRSSLFGKKITSVQGETAASPEMAQLNHEAQKYGVDISRMKPEKAIKAVNDAQDKHDFGNDWELRASDTSHSIDAHRKWVQSLDSFDPVAVFADNKGVDIGAKKSQLASLSDLATIDREVARYEKQRAEVQGVQKEGNRQSEAPSQAGNVSGRNGVRLPKGQQKLLEGERPKVSAESIKLKPSENKEIDKHNPNSLFGAKERAQAAKAQPDMFAKKKEPWQMTNVEFTKYKMRGLGKANAKIAEKIKKPTKAFAAQHRVEIKAAIDRGETIPEEVLKDYPDLQKKEPDHRHKLAQAPIPWLLDRAKVITTSKVIDGKEYKETTHSFEGTIPKAMKNQLIGLADSESKGAKGNRYTIRIRNTENSDDRIVIGFGTMRGSSGNLKFVRKQIEPVAKEGVTVYEVPGTERGGVREPGGTGEKGNMGRDVHTTSGIPRRAKLRKTGTIATGRTKVTSADDAAHIAASLRKNPQEHLSVIVLDKNNDVISVVNHSVGSRATTPSEPMSIVGSVASIKGAKSVYLVHNHPSDTARLSGDNGDMALFERLKPLYSAAGIEAKDMIAVTPSGRFGSARLNNMKISPAARSKSVPVVSRRFIGTKTGLNISSPEVLAAVKDKVAKGQTGVIIANHAREVTGFVPMSVKDMGALRVLKGKSTVARKLLSAMHEGNAAGLFAVVHDIQGHREELQNLSRFARAARVELTDVVSAKNTAEGGGITARESGNMPYTGSDTTFYSNPFLDPKAYKGLRKMAGEVLDSLGDLEITRKIRMGSRPMQAGSPEAAAIVKNWANEMAVSDHRIQKEIADNVKRFSVKDREAMISALEHPDRLKKLPEEQRKVVEAIKKESDSLGKIAVDMGIIGNVKENYARHIVLSLGDAKDVHKLFGSSFRTTVKTGKRVYDTFEEGEAKGIEYLKDINVMVKYNGELRQAIYSKMLVDAVRKRYEGTNGRLVGEPGEDIPNYVRINHPAFQQRRFHVTEKDGKKVVTITHKDMLVHPDMEGPLKALLAKKDPNAFYSALMGVKLAGMKVIMYSPMFHNMTVLFKNIPTLPASKIFTGRILSDYIQGYTYRKSEALVEDAIRHNLRLLSGKGYLQDIYGKINPAKKNVFHKIDPRLGTAIDKAGDIWHGMLLWNRIADMQMGVYARKAGEFEKASIKAFKKKHLKAPSEDELKGIKEDAKYQAATFANLIAGSIAKEDMGEGWRRTLNTALFSRTYTLSNLDLAKNGISAAAGSNALLPKYLLGQVKHGDPVVSRGMVRAFAGAAAGTFMKDIFLYYLTLQGLNYAFTAYYNLPDKNGKKGGHFAWDNEFRKKDKIAIAEKPSGQIVYMGNPFRAARDIVGMSGIGGPYKFREIWSHKMNPEISALFRLMDNKDWRGKTILGEDDAWYKQLGEGLFYFAKAVSGVDSLVTTFNPDNESWRNYYRVLGIQISHGSRGGPVVGELRHIKMNQRERMDKAIIEAAGLFRNGHKDKALKVLEDTGEFSPSQLRNFFARETVPKKYFLRNMNVRSMYRRGTPEEKKRMKKIAGNLK